MNDALSVAELHASLSDPALSSMNFLNEIVLRYPDAISFAPGRPREDDFEIAALGRYLDTYVTHLSEAAGYARRRIITELFQYGRTNGSIHPLIAQTVANDEGIEVDPEAVVVTVGAQEGMLLVLRALFRDSDDVLLVPDPCYVGITGAARLLDIELAPIPEDEQGVSPESVARTVAALRERGKRARALYLVPDFSNPSGTTMPEARRQELLAMTPGLGLYLLEDNPYGFFRSSGIPCPTIKSLDTERRVIYLGSFAKTCFPGARVGYVLADQPVRDAAGGSGMLAGELSKIKSMTTVNTPAVSQAVIGGMLLTHDCWLHEANAASIAHYQNNLRALIEELNQRFPVPERARLGVSWNSPEGGFFVVLRVAFAADDGALECAARDFGVLWTPTRHFHHSDRGANRLRLSCSSLRPEEVAEGVGRLAKFVWSRT
ncbi:PLP-dependent aminotransferase family protein [Nocardia sp. NPDC101769]|uniref:aminotransferase-like domain-containing protein n=1 Tax=Nocardia sp. NPDC101769 TaxID=3364333 RepID=UPI0038118FE7